jgi:hypothetical protein
MHNDICECLSIVLYLHLLFCTNSSILVFSFYVAKLEALPPQQMETPTVPQITCAVTVNGVRKGQLILTATKTVAEVKVILQGRHPADIDFVGVTLFDTVAKLDAHEVLSLGSSYNCRCRRKRGNFTVFCC